MNFPARYNLEIPEEIYTRWQEIVDTVTVNLKGVTAVINRYYPPFMEVFLSSNHQQTTFICGEKNKLAILYCGKVLKTDKSLQIVDARKDERWSRYPDLNHGMISYLGFPLKWPDGTFFGTFSLQSRAEMRFNKKSRQKIEHYLELMEAHLKIVYQDHLFTTQTNKREEELTRSQARYKTLFNKAPIGIFRTSLTGEPLSINPAMAEILGCSTIKEAMLRYKDLSKDLYANPERREEFLKKLKAEGEVKDFRYEAIQQDGSHIWISMNARINEYQQEGLFYIDGFAFDITASKEYEKELKEKNDELQSSYEQLEAFNEEVTAMNEELDQSIQEINELNKRFVNMVNVVSTLDRSMIDNDNKFLADLLSTAINIVPEADYGKICVIDEDGYCEFVAASGHEISLLKKTRIAKQSLFHSSKRGVYTSDDYSLDLSRITAEKREIFKSALKPIAKSIFINITIGEDVVGRITLDIAKDAAKGFSSTTKHLLRSFASLASAFFSFQRYHILQDQFTRELITSIIQILEMYDRYTSGHSQNVARLGTEIGREMGLARQDIEHIYWAGMVHDIGKLLIPLEILNKKGSLTPGESELMTKHPYWGYKALNNNKTLGSIAEYVLHHHERWDGKGYPANLKGKEIPLISQILTLADAWDAMTSKRAYRDKLPINEALQEIISNKGKQFSPGVVQAFLKYLQGLHLIESNNREN